MVKKQVNMAVRQAWSIMIKDLEQNNDFTVCARRCGERISFFYQQYDFESSFSRCRLQYKMFLLPTTNV